MKSIVIILSLLSSFAFAHVEEGNTYRLQKDVKFYPIHFKGIFAAANLFSTNPVLEEGHIFTVTRVSTHCRTEVIHAKYFRYCDRTIDLESDNCGFRNLDRVERIIGTDFTMYLRAKNGKCRINIDESDSDIGIMRKTSPELLDRRSEFNELFE